MNNSLLWLAPPNACLSISGLPFTRGEQWQRFTEQQLSVMPAPVCAQARFASGARLAFYSDSRELSLRASVLSPYKYQGIDIVVDGQLWKTLHHKETGESETKIFAGLEPKRRLFELYLPLQQSVDITGIGFDAGAMISPAANLGQPPMIFYGSSVTQGVGSGLSCMNYPSILSRRLNIDVVNFGFSGAGRAEASVVSEIAKVPARCFVLDLGKSFGKQADSVYRAMLETLRRSQPKTPIVVMTPIFCTKEHQSQEFEHFSNQLRAQFTRACDGIAHTTVVNGLDLLGVNDWEGLSGDGLHPNEYGYTLIAKRLMPFLS